MQGENKRRGHGALPRIPLFGRGETFSDNFSGGIAFGFDFIPGFNGVAVSKRG